jgi:hypothetical protein
MLFGVLVMDTRSDHVQGVADWNLTRLAALYKFRVQS